MFLAFARSINSTALLHRTTRATVDLSSILDLNIYASTSTSVVQATLAPFAEPPPPPPPCRGCSDDPESHSHAPGHSHSHSHAPSAHSNDITTVCIPLPPLPPFSTTTPTRFEALLRDLLWEGSLPPLPPSPSPTSSPEFDILRTKAFLRTTDGKSWILQGVREVHDLTAVPDTVDVAGLETKLVLIGRGFGDGEEVSRRFLDALEVE